MILNIVSSQAQFIVNYPIDFDTRVYLILRNRNTIPMVYVCYTGHILGLVAMQYIICLHAYYSCFVRCTKTGELCTSPSVYHRQVWQIFFIRFCNVENNRSFIVIGMQLIHVINMGLRHTTQSVRSRNILLNNRTYIFGKSDALCGEIQ